MTIWIRVSKQAWEAALRMANGIHNIKQGTEVRRSQLDQLGAAQVEFDRHKNKRDDAVLIGRLKEIVAAEEVIERSIRTCVAGDARSAAEALVNDGWFRAAAVQDDWRGPVPELQQSKPLVLYFQTDEDRQGFADLVHAIKPKMIARAL